MKNKLTMLLLVTTFVGVSYTADAKDGIEVAKRKKIVAKRERLSDLGTLEEGDKFKTKKSVKQAIKDAREALAKKGHR